MRVSHLLRSSYFETTREAAHPGFVERRSHVVEFACTGVSRRAATETEGFEEVNVNDSAQELYVPPRRPTRSKMGPEGRSARWGDELACLKSLLFMVSDVARPQAAIAYDVILTLNAEGVGVRVLEVRHNVGFQLSE